MGKKFNREKLKDFLLRRRLNFLSLVCVTALSVIVTLLCFIFHLIPNRVYILVVVSALLVLLCIIQALRMRSSFRTMKSFRGVRKKRSTEKTAD